jgi:hypothetical protein
MGDRGTRSNAPDLFSTVREPAPQSAVSISRYVLPKNLPSAIKQLNDDELERLMAAALAEQKVVAGSQQPFK